MKVGAEDKKKLYALVALMLLAAFFVARPFLSSNGGPTGVVASARNANGPDAANQRGRSTPPLDPTLRTDLLKNSEGTEYKGTGRNIFEAQAPLPQPVRQVVVEKAPPPALAMPPAPPPIPLKFYGFASKAGQPKSIFLANGEDIFIGREGDIVNRRYKIIRIMPTQVEIEDVLNNNRQSIPLTQG